MLTASKSANSKMDSTAAAGSANPDRSRPKVKGKASEVVLPVFPSVLVGIAAKAGFGSPTAGTSKHAAIDNLCDDKSSSTDAPVTPEQAESTVATGATVTAPNARLKRTGSSASLTAGTAATAAAAAAHAARAATTARVSRGSRPNSPGSSPTATPPGTHPASPVADISSSLSTPQSHASPMHGAGIVPSGRAINEGHALANLLYAQARGSKSGIEPPATAAAAARVDIAAIDSTPDGSDLELSSPEAIAPSDHHRRAHAQLIEMQMRTNNTCKSSEPEASLNAPAAGAVTDGGFGSAIYQASVATVNSSESSKPAAATADNHRPVSNASVNSMNSSPFRPTTTSISHHDVFRSAASNNAFGNSGLVPSSYVEVPEGGEGSAEHSMQELEGASVGNVLVHSRELSLAHGLDDDNECVFQFL